jgi:hypothetical protein
MSEQYSHRNGETEPPTEDGWYWVSSPPPVFREGTVLVVDGCVYDFQEDQFTLDELAGVQWWGPVTPPWEADNA